MFKLSRTEAVWMARLAKGPRRQQYGDDKAVGRLVGRGLVHVALTGPAKRRTRILSAMVS